MRRRRRRCVICGELFRADRRVGKRQRACGRRECQKERRRRTRAAWREANPDYDRDRRLRERIVAARQAARVSSPEAARARPPTVPRELRVLPWDLAQSELGVATVDFLALVVSLVLRIAQRQRSVQHIEGAGLPGS